MSETTEKMAPRAACEWYYNMQEAGREIEHSITAVGWSPDRDGFFHADRIYRLKQDGWHRRATDAESQLQAARDAMTKAKSALLGEAGGGVAVKILIKALAAGEEES